MTKAPADVIYRRSDCRGCGGQSFDLVLQLKPSPIGDAFISEDKLDVPQPSYPIDLFMCRDCGLAQLLDVIDPDVLYGDYLYVSSSSLGLPEHFVSYASSVVDRCRLPAGSLVVDLGSNDGTLLRAFKARGMEVLGVEPASHIAADAAKNGVPTMAEYFTADVARRIVAEHGHARAVTANNVFANIDDLGPWVEGLNELLGPGSVFVFESFYLADLVKNMVFDFIYHEHLTSFSVRPVQSLFERAGLELVAAQRVATKGGSLRYFIQRPNGPLQPDGSIDQLLAEEGRMGLYQTKMYEDFTRRIEGLKQQTRQFLQEARAEGKSVAGFGASITGTTLIYHFEIGDSLEYMVDDNPAKQGRFSPGLHIPVLPSSALEEKRPDCVLVLAWRYAEPFIAQHRSYLANGGTFVVPVPEFRVVEKD